MNNLKTRYVDGILELWDFVNDGGFIVRCYPNGSIRLFEVPLYGGEERFLSHYAIVNNALEDGYKMT